MCLYLLDVTCCSLCCWPLLRPCIYKLFKDVIPSQAQLAGRLSWDWGSCRTIGLWVVMCRCIWCVEDRLWLCGPAPIIPSFVVGTSCLYDPFQTSKVQSRQLHKPSLFDMSSCSSAKPTCPRNRHSGQLSLPPLRLCASSMSLMINSASRYRYDQRGPEPILSVQTSCYPSESLFWKGRHPLWPAISSARNAMLQRMA